MAIDGLLHILNPRLQHLRKPIPNGYVKLGFVVIWCVDHVFIVIPLSNYALIEFVKLLELELKVYVSTNDVLLIKILPLLPTIVALNQFHKEFAEELDDDAFEQVG